tara:strand:+ start:390 stop:569 length:180 start_codon:yes stop_codon:yes gene_type:complete
LQGVSMNGRIDKVAMLGKVMRIKDGIHRHQWYPHWQENERVAAQLALNNVLDVLDEYWE